MKKEKVILSGSPRMMAVMIFGLILSLSASQAWGDWTLLGVSLNMDPNQDSTLPSISLAGDTPYVTWVEDNPATSRTNIYVKRWDGSNWIQAGGNLNVDPNQNAYYPNMGCSVNSRYVIWREGPVPEQIYFTGWTGSGWAAPGSLNVNPADAAIYPHIFMQGDTPYVSWREGSGADLFVKYHNGTSWEIIGGAAVNTVAAGGYPNFALRGTTPLLAFWEGGAVVVKQYFGGTWQYVGNRLNEHPGEPTGMGGIAVNNNTPYVTWYEDTAGNDFQVYVKQYTGTTWALVGGSLNENPLQDAIYPRIGFVGNTPYVVMYEGPFSTANVFVKYYDGLNWVSLGGSLNLDTNSRGDAPSMAISSEGIYVAWTETDSTGDQIFVKQWPFATATPTVSPVPTATPPPDVGGIVENNQAAAYPIPASDRITFAFRTDGGSGEVIIRVYNTHYRLVETLTGQAPTGEGTVTWDVSSVAPGIYFYQVTIGDKKLPYEKMVIAR